VGISLQSRYVVDFRCFRILESIRLITLWSSLAFVFSFDLEAFQNNVDLFLVFFIFGVRALWSSNGAMLTVQNLFLQILDILQDLARDGGIPRSLGIFLYKVVLGFGLCVLLTSQRFDRLWDIQVVLDHGWWRLSYW
jgi:hypothetical protein